MRKILLLTTTLLVTLFMSAQEIPQKISYQGKLMENNVPFTGTKNLTFTIGSWSELHPNVQITEGLYSVTLGGEGTPIPISLFNNTSNLTLQVQVNGTYLNPDTEIEAVPYAFKTEEAVNTEKIAGNPVSGNPSTNEVLKWNGSQWIPNEDSDNQELSINGSDLSISGGNTVTLPSSSGGITQLEQGSGIILSPNPITSTGSISFENPFNGDFSATSTISTDSPSSSYDGGDIVADDDLIADDNVEVGDIIYSNEDHDTHGGFILYGTDGDEVAEIGFSSINEQNGVIRLSYSGNERAYLGSTSNSGELILYNSSGNATIILNGGTGVISGTSKQFRIDHPIDNTKSIVYTSLEGPEAAAYFRGTAKLINGKAHIDYPEHFNLVINKSTITVILTPFSAESKGLAVLQKTEHGIEVIELFHGNGNYEFDYEVKGVRLGYENYEVIQDKIVHSSVISPINDDDE